MRRVSGVTWLLFALTTLAVAGIVHIVSVLALPYRAPDDAFVRIAAIVPLNSVKRLADPGRVPFRDPVMAEAICRYDLHAGPLRVSIGQFDRDFLSIGFHSRHGVAFSGLTIRSSDSTALDLVLLPPDDKPPDDDDAEPNRDILFKAPEREGFITIQTPIGASQDVDSANDVLSRMRCAPDLAFWRTATRDGANASSAPRSIIAPCESKPQKTTPPCHIASNHKTL